MVYTDKTVTTDSIEDFMDEIIKDEFKEYEVTKKEDISPKGSFGAILGGVDLLKDNSERKVLIAYEVYPGMYAVKILNDNEYNVPIANAGDSFITVDFYHNALRFSSTIGASTIPHVKFLNIKKGN